MGVGVGSAVGVGVGSGAGVGDGSGVGFGVGSGSGCGGPTVAIGRIGLCVGVAGSFCAVGTVVRTLVESEPALPS